MTITQFLFTWFGSGIIAGIAFWYLFAADSNTGKAIFSTILVIVAGYLGAALTILLSVGDYHQAKANKWWESLGKQKQAILMEVSLMDYLKGKYSVTDTGRASFHRKFRDSVSADTGLAELSEIVEKKKTPKAAA
jgi:hypothetical protein